MWWCGSVIYRVLYLLRRSCAYDGVKKQYIEYCALYVVFSCYHVWGSFFNDLIDKISNTCGKT